MSQNALPSAESGNSYQHGPAESAHAPHPPAGLTATGRYGSIYLGQMQPGGEPPFWRNQAKLIVVLSAGLCTITRRLRGSEAQVVQVAEGQLCLIGAAATFDFACEKATALAVIGIDPAALAEFSSANSGDIALLELEDLGRTDVMIWDIVARLRHLCRWETQPSAGYLESLATLFSVHVLQAATAPAKAPKPGLCPAQMRQVHDFIKKHLSEPIAVATLAREAHLSPYHFTRLFKQTTGLSPHRYLTNCRVEEAYTLLRDGNHRVADAAYAVGFCDQSHLDRHFRRRYGYAPRTLLRQPNAQI